MTLVVNTCQIGPYTFIEVADHGFEAHAGHKVERGLERRGFVIAREVYREGDDR